MKKIFITLLLATVVFCSFAQTPQAFKYQAIARNNLGDPVINQLVSIRVSLLEESVSGTAVYTETHQPTTNQFGLFSLEIGNGTVVEGDFTSITWGENTYYLQIEMDESGGTNYLLLGTSQLLSVPYAQEAAHARSLTLTGANGTEYEVTVDAYNNLVIVPTTWSCGDSLLFDSRDGRLYETVQIGSQCWMADNLNISTMIHSETGGTNGDGEQTNNGTIEKYCYSNFIANCETYGGLYQWNEMMQYSTVEGVQGICPDGWHIATDEEWKMLEGEADSQFGYPVPEWDKLNEWRGTDAGSNLKSETGWDEPGTNSTGFTALPVGRRHPNGTFQYDNNTYLWSSTEYTAANALRRQLYEAGVNRYAQDKAYGESVRCLKDFINQPPNQPSNPNPADDAIEIGINNDLYWTCSDPEGYNLDYNVYFGTETDPPLMAEHHSEASYDPGTLDYSTTYYWKVIAFDNYGGFAVSEEWSFTTNVPPAIGDYAYGGVVFYIDGSDGGLVCAVSDQSTGAAWGCQGTEINGADGFEIGTGAQNTIDIEAGCTTSGIAADICSNLALNGYADWFLPSLYELNEMYLNNAAINATATANGGSAFYGEYWSSTEGDPEFGLLMELYSGGMFGVSKNGTSRVRAVRAF